LTFFYLKNDVNVPSKNNKQENVFFKLAFCWRLERSMTKVAGSGYESGSGSISQRHGSPNPDPYPYQNVMDPQHCLVITDSDPGGPKTYRYGSGSGSATPGIKLNILPILLTKMSLLRKPYVPVSAWRLYFAGSLIFTLHL
jgi:hypothetical protein